MRGPCRCPTEVVTGEPIAFFPYVCVALQLCPTWLSSGRYLATVLLRLAACFMVWHSRSVAFRPPAVRLRCCRDQFLMTGAAAHGRSSSSIDLQLRAITLWQAAAVPTGRNSASQRPAAHCFMQSHIGSDWMSVLGLVRAHRLSTDLVIRGLWNFVWQLQFKTPTAATPYGKPFGARRQVSNSLPSIPKRQVLVVSWFAALPEGSDRVQ